jgi:hypothetical protein
LWGFNVQAGVYPDYGALDHLVARFERLGINAVRLWPIEGTFYDAKSAGGTHLAGARRGDGSLLDRYDYLVAALRARGIFVMNPALHHMDVSAIRFWPDPEVWKIVSGLREREAVRMIHGIAPYLSDGYRAMVEHHVRNYLEHVNPYTQRRYAEEEVFAGWELANEAKFVSCLTDAACLEKLPTFLQQRIALLWNDFQGGTPPSEFRDLPPFKSGWAGAPGSSVNRAYREFVVARFLSVSRQIETYARSFAHDRGISVQPFSFGTHAGAPSLLAHMADAGGDFVSIGTYQTPLSGPSTAAYAPWKPWVTRFPSLYNFNFGAVEGKPLVVYEASFFRPYPYRAEWAAALLALAASQDWDAVFLYMYGQPRFIYRAAGGTEIYGAVPLPNPQSMRPGDPNDYTVGFHHGGDQTVMASWALAGTGFLRGKTRPLVPSYKVRFGAASLYGPGNGYCRAAQGCNALSDETALGWLYDLGANGRTRLQFDASSQTTEIPPCKSCRSSSRGGGQYPLGPDITWDGSAAQSRFDTPYFKAVFGQQTGRVTFSDGILFEFPQAGFGCAGLASDGATPINTARRLSIWLCTDTENPDFSFDASAVDARRPYGAIAGVRSPGRMGPKSTRITTRIVLPNWQGTLRLYDFNFRLVGEREVNGEVSLAPGEVPFLLELIRR